MVRILRVTAVGKSGHVICAGAEVVKVDGKWQFRRMAPVLEWMRKGGVENAGRFLKGPGRGRWRYEWLKDEKTDTDLCKDRRDIRV